MTQKLYYENAYLSDFEATVLSCEEKNGEYAVILDKTAFFPEGGGQPGDTGFIGCNDVSDTLEADGEVVHICRAPVEAGSTQRCRIDFERRFSHMQQHTGEHIFSGILHCVCGYDNVGFHMGARFVTVDFNGAVTSQELCRVEALANEAVYKNLPVEELFPSAQELEKLSYRFKKEIAGQVRLIKIEGCDLCACCGTHTASTGEVGLIKAVNMINYKSGVRITLQIGRRALADYCEKNANVYAVSQLLSAKPEEITEGVERLLGQCDALKADNAALRRRLLSLISSRTPKETNVVFEPELDAAQVHELCDMLAQERAYAAVFSGSDGSGYKFALASRCEDIREKGKALCSACGGRGGGKSELVQGTLNAPQEEITKFFE